MVILITGASHTGKTLMAQRMLEKYKYPYLSIDHLKMGFIRSGMTALTPEDDDALTDELWPIVRREMTEAYFHDYAHHGFCRPFDIMGDEPLIRVEIAATHEKKYLLVDIHHMVTDDTIIGFDYLNVNER